MANDDKKGGVNPVVASLAGAAIGAAAAAGAIILSDKKNRAKFEKVVGDLKKEGFKVMQIVQEEVGAVKEIASGKKGSASKSKKK
jgi:hypothetical protein